MTMTISAAARDLLAAAAVILAALGLLALALAARAGRRKGPARGSALYPAPGTGTDADVWRLLDAGERELAVELYRELYRVDSKSAEAAVEALAGSGRSG